MMVKFMAGQDRPGSVVPITLIISTLGSHMF